MAASLCCIATRTSTGSLRSSRSRASAFLDRALGARSYRAMRAPPGCRRDACASSQAEQRQPTSRRPLLASGGGPRRRDESPCWCCGEDSAPCVLATVGTSLWPVAGKSVVDDVLGGLELEQALLATVPRYQDTGDHREC